MLKNKGLAKSGQAQTKKVVESLERVGLTATSQRIAILHYIWYGSHHPTADEIREFALENLPTISTGTIYNSINAFLENNLIKSVSLPGSRVVRYEANAANHYHLINTDNGELIDLPIDKVNFSHDLKDYDIERVEIFVYGKKK